MWIHIVEKSIEALLGLGVFGIDRRGEVFAVIHLCQQPVQVRPVLEPGINIGGGQRTLGQVIRKGLHLLPRPIHEYFGRAGES